MPKETVVKEAQETKETKPEEKEVDLVTRVSQVKPEEKKEESFNINDIEKIEDPQAKEYAQKAYKSFEKGYQEKFRTLAEERKSWEAKRAEGDNWTSDKVQSLLKDPKFVDAAQSVLGQGNDDYSALSDADKKQVQEAKLLAKQALEQNAQLLKAQQDERLQGKYANYKPEAVDILTADLLAGKVQATREHLWKVQDYDAAVRRAYKLGLDDKKLVNQEKATSMSIEGTTQQATEGAVEKEKTETDKQWFVRNALNRLVKSKEGQIRK